MKKYSYVTRHWQIGKKELQFRVSYGYRYEKVVRDKTLVFFIEKMTYGYNATEETSGMSVVGANAKTDTIKDTKKYIDNIADAIYYALLSDHVKLAVQQTTEWKKENNYTMVVQSGAQ